MISVRGLERRPQGKLFTDLGGSKAPVCTKFMYDVGGVISSNVRSKPSYVDFWLLGDPQRLEVIDEYDVNGAHVVIGTTPEGTTEYNLFPLEFAATELANEMISESIMRVREAFRRNGGISEEQTVGNAVQLVLQERTPDVSDPSSAESRTASLRMEDIVRRHSIGLGVFDILLSDPKIEDIYVDAPCEDGPVHVTVGGGTDGNTHMGCNTNIYLEKREVSNLINVLKRSSGLPYCSTNPVLETDVPAYNARATVIGYPMSPSGDAVAIRRHSDIPWTLTRLIANGTMTAEQAGLLSFLVNNRATLLICGARGAGKSSLLQAMMMEHSPQKRLIVVQDLEELPCARMRKMGYKVQSILVDEHIDGSSASRAAEAMRVSLRLGESGIVIGEVRGEEAKVLYESMHTGKAGSSIMGTIHGDSARTVYDRVVHDMGISPDAFAATDVIVTMGTFRDRSTGADRRRISEIAATIGRDGSFADIDPENPQMSLGVLKRAAEGASLTPQEALDEIRARQLIHNYLAEKGRECSDYLSPEWIQIANAKAVAMAGRPDREIIEAAGRMVPPGRRGSR